VDGKFVRLHEDKSKAEGIWHAICAEHTHPSVVPLTKVVLKKYFEWLKLNRAETTWSRREPLLRSFSKGHGRLKVTAIKPHHVVTWAGENWPDASPTTVHKGIAAIQAAFSWAHREGLSPHNPIAKVDKPTPTAREDFVLVEDWPKLLQACTPPFGLDHNSGGCQH